MQYQIKSLDVMEEDDGSGGSESLSNGGESSQKDGEGPGEPDPGPDRSRNDDETATHTRIENGTGKSARNGDETATHTGFENGKAVPARNKDGTTVPARNKDGTTVPARNKDGTTIPARNKDGTTTPARKGDAPARDSDTKATSRKVKKHLAGDETVPPRRKKWYGGMVKDVLISGAIVLSLLLVLYLYSGVWPPMVVIESQSMMHGEDSQFGVIDTGDLTLVKMVSNRDDVITYVEATCKTGPDYGFKTYGDFGNVVIYRKNGLAETPVIHRAIAWIEYNDSASNRASHVYRGDLPDIGVYNVSEYTVYGIKSYYPGSTNQPVTIHLSSIFAATTTSQIPHSGFVTKGDHNIPYVDQEVLGLQGGGRVEPVRINWVIGKAEGELPWFGLFKLWISGHNSQTFPPTSVRGLVGTVIVLIVVPIVVDYILSIMKKRKESRKQAREKSRGFKSK